MLEYSKIILKKVSFDSGLFEKELKKSLSYLRHDEIEELLTWVKAHHGEYANILASVQEWFLK